MCAGFSQEILWRNFFNIQQILCLNDEQFAHFLEISPKVFESLCKNKSILPLDIAATLSEKLFFDIVDFLEKDLDMDAISSVYYKLAQLPERYRPAAFSRARTLTHIFDYIERKQGKLRKNIILRKFQTDGRFFSNPENLLNIHFITDLTEHLHHLGYTQEDFFQMGRNSALVNSRGAVRDRLQDAKTVRDGFEKFVSCAAPMFDRNCDYIIKKITNEKIVIDVPVRTEVQDALNSKVIANEHICQVKMGIISAIPMYLGIPQYVPVKKIHSVFDGNPSNVYEADLSIFANLSSDRNTDLPAIYQ